MVRRWEAEEVAPPPPSSVRLVPLALSTATLAYGIPDLAIIHIRRMIVRGADTTPNVQAVAW